MLKKNKLYEILIFLIPLATFVSIALMNSSEVLHFDFSKLDFWDGGYYQKIAFEKYADEKVAFFPMFPKLWGLLNLSVVQITVFNALLYLGSFWALYRYLDLEKEIVCFIIIPSAIFYFLTYSEAVFFFSATIMLIGLWRKLEYLVLGGLFLIILSRPAFTILVPALLIMHFIYKERLFVLFVRLSVVLIGVFTVALIQYQDTGEWFEFFSAQSQWDNEIRIPKFPLLTWGGDYTLKIDGTALLMGALSGFYFLIVLLKKRAKQINQTAMISLLYLSGISLLVLMFRGGQL